MEIDRASQPSAGRLGEIVNGARSSTYFTKPAAAGRQRKVYFYFISIVFPFNYFTKRSAVYFYPISIVFLLCTWYIVPGTLILIPDFRPPAFPIAGAHGIRKVIRLSAF